VVPRHTPRQNDGPTHESDGEPVAPLAAPVSTAPDQVPDEKWNASPRTPSATHDRVDGHSTASSAEPPEMFVGEDQLLERGLVVVEVDLWLVVDVWDVCDVVVCPAFLFPDTEHAEAVSVNPTRSAQSATLHGHPLR
jgi:hypothetical protein